MPKSTNTEDKPSRRMSKRADKGNNNESGNAPQNQQSPIPSGRRSSIMSWRTRNSTASIVEDAPPASCPLSCQRSSCFIGSLNGSISEVHLPLLSKQTKSRLNALKTQPKQRKLEITIERSDELPFGAYSHPQVRVHIVDRCTGRALCPPQITSEAKFSAGLSNTDCTNVFEWQQTLGITVDMPTFLNTRMVLLFEILETKPPTKGTRFRRGTRFESVSTHDEDDEYHKAPPATDYRRIAWGFFHTITSKGNLTMNSFVLPLHGQQLQRGVWGTHFFHDCPVLDVSWSPTAHMAALCSYGGNNPIVVLCSYRDDKEAAFMDESTANTSNTSNAMGLQQLAVDAFRVNNQQDALSGDHAQRLQRALERRQKRLQAKLSSETKANTDPTSSVAV
ncbi:WD40 repeat-like protein [Phytophthora cinnamomi]|uniref:WD40 repeat-like protein n=1 Tax=Phytophthora cinnamomi TaxID=4785 RepID=UPI003559A374|nr:WD40 repeat-like protein [Phytophthora cinnamomi]